MGQPIATKTSGFICFAFPDICPTQIGPATVPIPYPNIGDLGNAEQTSQADNVFINGEPIILNDSLIRQTIGDDAGVPGKTKGSVKFTSFSENVRVNDKGIVRMFDSTSQNNGCGMG